MRQRQPALQFAEPRRNVERRHAAELLGAFRKRQLILVDVAERHDARQDRGVRLQLVEKDLPRQPPGAPGRQIERRRCEIEWIPARLESLDQPAVDQRRDDGAQERHGEGNAENAHGLPDSRSGANIGGDEGEVMRVRAASPLLTAKAVRAHSTLHGVVFEIFCLNRCGRTAEEYLHCGPGGTNR